MEGIERTLQESKLVNNTQYYKYIFKKTEKIVCAVFYILKKTDTEKDNTAVIRDLEKTALETINTTLESLAVSESAATDILNALAHKLIALESKIKILAAMDVVSEQHLSIFHNEIDSVLRTLRNSDYFKGHNPLLEADDIKAMPDTGRGTRAYSRIPNGQSMQVGTPGGGTLPGRKTRILDVLKSKDNASIKDISETVMDCSEKTIQRELNALIKDGKVLRKGQRRWSTYTLV